MLEAGRRLLVGSNPYIVTNGLKSPALVVLTRILFTKDMAVTRVQPCDGMPRAPAVAGKAPLATGESGTEAARSHGLGRGFMRAPGGGADGLGGTSTMSSRIPGGV